MPFKTTSRLFDKSLASHLKELEEEQRQNVLNASAAELAADEVERLLENAHVTPPRLLRDEGQFSPDTTGGDVQVRLTVPVEGMVTLLRYSPISAAPWPKSPTVEMTDTPHWSPLQVEEDERPGLGAITFSQRFHGEATTAEVRAHYTALVDKVDLYALALAEDVEKHNRHTARAIKLLADNRRKALTSTDTLADELGRGI